MKDIDLNQLEHSLIICPDAYRKKILDELSHEKKIIDVKFMNKEEYLKRYCFDYDTKAVKYLKDHYGYSVANAREILDHLHFAEDKKYGSEKLDLLVRVRKELDEKDLLIYDPLFLQSIRDRRLIVIGYGKIPKEEKRIFDGQVIPFSYEEKKYEIVHFSEIEEETAYLYDSIADLLDQGVEIDRIHVLGYSADYESYFRRFNGYYGFTIEINDEDTLIGTGEGLKLLDMIGSMKKKEIYKVLSERGDEISEKLIRLINRYPEYELDEVKEFIITDLKKTKISDSRYRNVVHCDEFFSLFDEDDHVFLIGFNDTVPALMKDTGYITDSLSEKVGLSSTEEKNALIRKNARAYLSGIADLHISYCDKSPFRQYEISNLFLKDEYELVKAQDRIHAKAYDHLRYGTFMDRFYRYKTVEEDLPDLYDIFGKEPFLTYDNRFNGLNGKQLEQIVPIRLSYSSMDRFYHCAFAYYIENILGLNEYEDTFYTLSGTLCHEVLKDLFVKDDFDFERSWKENLEKMEKDGKSFVDEKENFFISRIREELKQDVDIILKQKSMTGFDSELCEKGFLVNAGDNVVFKGFIDKVMYKEKDDQIFVDVIDYKTGNSAKIRKKLMPFGLCLQLPSYMYLLSRDPISEKELSFCGFYLQHLINGDLNYDEEKDRRQIKEDSMKLDGFTSSDPDRLFYSDRSFEDNTSKMIRGLRLKNDGGFYGNSPVRSDEEISGLIGLTEKKIEEASKRILEGDYRINPKQIDGVNESCGFCPYRPLCYKRDSDLQVISTKEDEADG